MIDHARAQELLALKLYGELDGEEGAILRAHQESCPACRAYEQEITRDLGTVASFERRSPVDEAFWLESIADHVPRLHRPRRRLWPFAASAASFAAGILLTLAITRADPAATPPPSGAAGPTVRAAFARATAPPLATTQGPLTRLARSGG